MATGLQAAAAMSRARQNEIDNAGMSDVLGGGEILASSPSKDSKMDTDEQSSQMDSIDGKEKKYTNTFLGSIRDFFNAPNVKITHGKTVSDVPCKKIREVRFEDVCAFEAPAGSLTMVHNSRLKRMNEEKVDKTPVAGITNWKRRNTSCWGVILSLYDRLKDDSGNVGDPVADCLAVIARPNNCILVLADGVSWGDRSRMAARSAVYGSLTYLTQEGTLGSALTTRDVFRSILRSFENAQKMITEEEATLTTLCVGVVVELNEKDKWGLCVVNVGDSLAFVYNETTGVREVTVGSHTIDQERDMRFSGGALGPADGYNPDLSNLTCSFTLLETGDLVYLTSDGISDNFDPGVGKFPIDVKSSPNPGLAQRKPLTPRERHNGMLQKMQQIIETKEDLTEDEKSASRICAKFMNFAALNTTRRRALLEALSLSEEELSKLSSKERKERSQRIKEQLESTPGKLDHASIVAYHVNYLEPAPLVMVRRPSEDIWDNLNATGIDDDFCPSQPHNETYLDPDPPDELPTDQERESGKEDMFKVLLKETTL